MQIRQGRAVNEARDVIQQSNEYFYRTLDAAQQADRGYHFRMRSIAERIYAYKVRMWTLQESIDTVYFDFHGITLTDTLAQQQQLIALKEKAEDIFKGLFNENGINWDKVKALLHPSVNVSEPSFHNPSWAMISEAEFLALARLFADMTCGDDITQFINLIALPLGEVTPTPFNDTHNPPTFMEWELCPHRVEGLMQALDTQSRMVAEKQYDAFRAMDRTVFLEHGREQAAIIQRAVLLGHLAEIQSEVGPFRGEVGNDRPISVVAVPAAARQSVSFDVSFSNEQTAQARSLDHVMGTMRFDHLHTNTHTISYALWGGEATHRVRENERAFWGLNSPVSITDIAASYTATTALKKALTEGAKQVTPSVGKLPLFLPLDIALAYQKEVQLRNNLNASFDPRVAADLAGIIYSHTVVVTDGTAEQRLIKIPSFQTQERIDALNRAAEYLRDSPYFELIVDPERHGTFNGNFTFENIVLYPDEVDRFIYDNKLREMIGGNR